MENCFLKQQKVKNWVYRGYFAGPKASKQFLTSYALNVLGCFQSEGSWVAGFRFEGGEGCRVPGESGGRAPWFYSTATSI